MSFADATAVRADGDRFEAEVNEGWDIVAAIPSCVLMILP